jgi:SAM-dependent methyltransferase
MANFAPLKAHMLYCLDRFVEQYGLAGPFLEIGCGKGDAAAHLARKGWAGTAVDFSASAIEHARIALAPFPQVSVRHAALEEVTGSFATILMWDVLEHIEDDAAALACVERLLAPGGHLLLAVPSHPREWRWDDDFYGHVRRYTVEDLSRRLADAGLGVVTFWDFTFPVFWAMRRAYTRLKRAAPAPADADAATRASATRNAWDLPWVSRILDRSAVLWWPVHRLQFALCRDATSLGHEFFALARKPAG